ncbi:hypothetical protein [Pandoraea iniqua]|nr:hypothetical protein [Pandoraea iniqua]
MDTSSLLRKEVGAFCLDVLLNPGMSNEVCASRIAQSAGKLDGHLTSAQSYRSATRESTSPNAKSDGVQSIEVPDHLVNQGARIALEIRKALVQTATGDSVLLMSWYGQLRDRLECVGVRAALQASAVGCALIEVVDEWSAALPRERARWRSASSDAQMQFRAACDAAAGGKDGAQRVPFADLQKSISAMANVLKYVTLPVVTDVERQAIHDEICQCLDKSMTGLVRRAQGFSLEQMRSVAQALSCVDDYLQLARDQRSDALFSQPAATATSVKRFGEMFTASLVDPARHRADISVNDVLGELLGLESVESSDGVGSTNRYRTLVERLARAAANVSQAALMQDALALADGTPKTRSQDEIFKAFMGRYEANLTSKGRASFERLLKTHAMDLRALLRTLEAGEAALLAQADSAGLSAIPSEITNTRRLLAYLLNNLTVRDSFQGLRPQRSMPTEMRHAVLHTFGLNVDGRTGSVSSTHRFATDFVKDWQTVVNKVRVLKDDLLDEANKQKVPPLRTEKTQFHKDLDRSRYVIASSTFDASRDASRAAAAAKELKLPEKEEEAAIQTAIQSVVHAIQDNLADFAADTEFAAWLGAYVNQQGMEMAINLMGEELDRTRAAQAHLRIAGRDDFVFFGPSAGFNLSAPAQPTFIVSAYDDEHVRIEFVYAAPSVKAVTGLDLRTNSLDPLDPSTSLDPQASCWYGRYSVILGRDGNARLDGPLHIHGILTSSLDGV